MLNQLEKLTAEAEHLDGGGEVLVGCEEHMYFPKRLGLQKMGISPPIDEHGRFRSCVGCAKAYWMVFLAGVPLERRREALEKIYISARLLAEGVDFTPFRHPEITIEKGD